MDIRKYTKKEKSPEIKENHNEKRTIQTHKTTIQENLKKLIREEGSKKKKSEYIILERSEIRKKEEYFWDFKKQFVIVVLVETWLEEKSWEKIRKR